MEVDVKQEVKQEVVAKVDAKTQKKIEKQQKQEAILKSNIEQWDPQKDTKISGDPYKTLFVGRLVLKFYFIFYYLFIIIIIFMSFFFSTLFRVMRQRNLN